MNAPHFSSGELRQLREHGIVIWAGRVIFNARPPLDEVSIARVRAHCRGPLPEDLLDLWRHTAGGNLDYDLSLAMDGNREAISWCELFYDGSDGYHDLAGWIDHELEQAQEAAEQHGHSWDGKLSVLPIGGFEYCDRIYVVADRRAKDHGQVLAWKMGLPPAWTHALHQDAVVTMAPDLKAAFQTLGLERDPLTDDDADTGQEFLDYLALRQQEHGLPDDLAGKITDFYRTALYDWQGPLQAGELGRQPHLAAIALAEAARRDDTRLLKRLADQGVDLGAPLQGGAGAAHLALRHHAHGVLNTLLDLGVPMPARLLNDLKGPLPAVLVERLLRLPDQASTIAVLRAQVHGDPDSAARIRDRLPEPERAALVEERHAMLASLQEDLRKVRLGQLGHYLGEDGLQLWIQRLQDQ